MQKVSYMGNDSTTEFTFNFPYFENSNIIVTKNGASTTGYSIVGTSAAPDADIPYTGGKVVFETAPTSLDCITIARSLPLSRVVDYQPTAKIEPTTLNQDMNYLMEILKDFNDDLETFATQYSEIVDKESTTNLLAKITAIGESITNVSAQITALGDVSVIRSDITALKDMSNLTDTGKEKVAHLAMPGTSYEDLTLEASGSTYTAPADGYINFIKKSVYANEYISFDSSVSVSDISPSAGKTLFILAPVAKGAQYTIYYDAGGNTVRFRFVYAEGAQ